MCPAYAVIGLGALFTFNVLEQMAIAAGVAVFLNVVLDVNLPFIANAAE